jgi:uncharacterized protein YbjQ (UPF0145 family)
MILTTTSIVEGHPVAEYKGVVTGETIIGANVLKDFMAAPRMRRCCVRQRILP